MLEAGAEDYLAKPFSLDELLARVRARLRVATGRATSLVAGRLRLDLIRREADSGSGPVALADREFLLLRELMQHTGTTVSKQRLLSAVWKYHFDPGSNVVDVYVRRLRAKLGADTITTMRGEGYRIVAPDRLTWPLASGWLDLAWVGFALANLVAMALAPEWETVPFHFIWVSLTLLYGFRVWGPRRDGGCAHRCGRVDRRVAGLRRHAVTRSSPTS